VQDFYFLFSNKIKLKYSIMKKSILLLVFAAFIGFAANAQNQKTTTGSTTSTTKPVAQPTTQAQKNPLSKFRQLWKPLSKPSMQVPLHPGR
jgi:hypothetical protein